MGVVTFAEKARSWHRRPKCRVQRLAQRHHWRVLVGVGESHFPYLLRPYFLNFGPPHPGALPRSFGASCSVRVPPAALATSRSPLQKTTPRALIQTRVQHLTTCNPSASYMPTHTHHVLTNTPHRAALYSHSPTPTARFMHISSHADSARTTHTTLTQT